MNARPLYHGDTETRRDFHSVGFAESKAALNEDEGCVRGEDFLGFSVPPCLRGKDPIEDCRR